MTDELLKDPKFLRQIQNLCPKKGDQVTEITISSGDRSVTLTHETRETCNRLLKDNRMKGEERKVKREGE